MFLLPIILEFSDIMGLFSQLILVNSNTIDFEKAIENSRNAKICQKQDLIKACHNPYASAYIAGSAPFLTPYKTWGTSHFVRYFWNLLSKNLTKCEII